MFWSPELQVSEKLKSSSTKTDAAVALTRIGKGSFYTRICGLTTITAITNLTITANKDTALCAALCMAHPLSKLLLPKGCHSPHLWETHP